MWAPQSVCSPTVGGAATVMQFYRFHVDAAICLEAACPNGLFSSSTAAVQAIFRRTVGPRILSFLVVRVPPTHFDAEHVEAEMRAALPTASCIRIEDVSPP